MSGELKLYTLAAASSALQAIFGSSPFRVYDTQIPQGVVVPGNTGQLCAARFWRISTIRSYEMLGIQPLSLIRWQIDILHPLAETARTAAAAFIDFLGTVDLAGTYQFGSPTVTPPQFPCFVLSQRGGIEPPFEPPVFVQTIDFRAYNLEE